MNQDEELLLSKINSETSLVDIQFLLKRAQKYRSLLQQMLDKNVNPRSLFKKLGGERFIDCMIAVDNAEAKKKANELNNPELELNMSHFEDTVDFIQYLDRIKNDHQGNSPFLLRAVVPNLGKHHTLYCEVMIFEGKTTIVGIESSNKKLGVGVMQELYRIQRMFPNAIHNIGVIVSNMQKNANGCDFFSIVNGIRTKAARGELNEFHAQLRSREKDKPLLVIDSYGNLLEWNIYSPANSRAQLESVVDNPKNKSLNLEEAPLPDHRDRKPILSHHDSTRVTQIVFDPDTSTSQKKQFGNTLDVERIEKLDIFIEHLKDLIKKHKNDAARIFTSELAEVWVSRSSDWDRFLPLTKSLSSEWDITKSRPWEESHSCWKNTVEEKLQMFGEILDAIPHWDLSPTVRSGFIERIVKETGLIEDSERLQSWRQILIKAMPKLMETYSTVACTDKEFGNFLSLHTRFMKLIPKHDRTMYLIELAKLIIKLNRQSLKEALGKHLLKLIAQDTKDHEIGYKADHAKILLTIANEWLHEGTPSSNVNESDKLNKFATLTIGRNHFSPQSKAQEEFDAIKELVFNFDKETIRLIADNDSIPDLNQKLKSVKNVSIDDLTTVVATLKENHEGWLSNSALKEQVAAAGLPKIDEDMKAEEDDRDLQHPTAVIKQLQRMQNRLMNNLPQDLSQDQLTQWKNEQKDSDNLFDYLIRQLNGTLQPHEKAFPEQTVTSNILMHRERINLVEQEISKLRETQATSSKLKRKRSAGQISPIQETESSQLTQPLSIATRNVIRRQVGEIPDDARTALVGDRIKKQDIVFGLLQNPADSSRPSILINRKIAPKVIEITYDQLEHLGRQALIQKFLNGGKFNIDAGFTIPEPQSKKRKLRNRGLSPQ